MRFNIKEFFDLYKLHKNQSQNPLDEEQLRKYKKLFYQFQDYVYWLNIDDYSEINYKIISK